MEVMGHGVLAFVPPGPSRWSGWRQHVMTYRKHRVAVVLLRTNPFANARGLMASAECAALFRPTPYALSPLPTDDRQAMRRIKHNLRPAVQATAGKHVLGSQPRHTGKHRPPTRQSHAGRAGQVKNIVAVQEHREHVGAANDANAARRGIERGQGLLERS